MTNTEAIKILNKCRDRGFERTTYTIEEYHTARDMAIKALQEQADGEYIPRDAVIDQLHQSINLLEAEDRIKDMPSVAIPTAEPYKGMTNGEVITEILKDAEWAELSSDFGLAQEDTIYIKVGGYWWNSPYKPQERSE